MTALTAQATPRDTSPTALAVTVYDVSNDSWLGGQNNIALMSKPLPTGDILIMRKNGDFAIASATRDIKRHLEHNITPVTTPHDTSDLLSKFLPVVSDLELKTAATEASSKQYSKLAIGDRFYLMYLAGENKGDIEMVHKAESFGKKRRHEWSHQTPEDFAQGKRSSSSFCSPARDVLILNEKEHTNIQAMIQDPIVRGQGSVSEYLEATTNINNQIIRIAKAMGPRATFSLLNYTAGTGTITLGKVRLTIALTDIDTLDISVTIGDTLFDSKDDLHSVLERVALTGGIITTYITYSYLGSTCFNMMRLAVAHSKRKN